MKNIIRITLLSLLLSLPLVAMQAQDEAAADITTQGNNVFIQSAVEATLTANANGGSTLTLNNVGPFTPWITPDLRVNSIDNIDMQTNWDDSRTPALLKVGTLNISLNVSGLRYDARANQMEYNVQVVNIDAPTALAAEENALPPIMENVTLIIPANLDFTLSLLIGDDFVSFNEMPNVRAAIEADCNPATLASLEALLPQADEETAANIQATLDACAE